MLENLKSLSDDPDDLKGLVALMGEEIKSLTLKVEDLEGQLAAHRKAAQSDAPTKRKHSRAPLTDHLERQTEVLSAGGACASCGGALRQLGEDVTHELEYIPGRFVVHQIVRPRMTCNCCETVA